MAGKKRQNWPYIRKRRYETGRVVWQVDARTKTGGDRRTFDTQLEAETFAEQQRIKRQNEGNVAFVISGADRLDAEAALALIKPHGHTLVDAARFFIRHLDTVQSEKRVGEVIDELLDVKEKDGASPRYLKDLRTRLKIFAETFGERLVPEIASSELDDWLRDLPHGPVTRNNYRRLLGVLFSYAKQRRYCVENPAQETARAKAVKNRPGVLSVEEAQNLLVAATDEIRPAIALGLFAGLRPESEVWRLDWSRIDFEAKHIDVAPDATKNRGDESEGAAHRYVTMVPALIAWLEPLRKKSGPVSPKGERYFSLLQAAREKAKITDWPHDALRHTYGSMHYAHFKNVGATMAEMGHTNPKTFFRHYRARVQPKEADRYWQIMPEANNKGVEQGTEQEVLNAAGGTPSISE